MTQVNRTDPIQILRNHEGRIAALERAPKSTIYIDDRVITDPVSVVTFNGFPSNREILELTWSIYADAALFWAELVYQGDYPVTENDYRWRLFGDVSASDGGGSDSSAALGGPGIGPYSDGPCWGRVRFPNYGGIGATATLQGDGGVCGDDGSPHTYLISGFGDPSAPITEINIFAQAATAAGGGPPDGTNIISPSRLTLTCY